MLSNLKDLYRHRALVAILTERELKARYRGSALGFLWSLLNPLLMLTVYAVVFSFLLPNRAEGTQPYALFLFTGLLPWNYLASALTDAASSLQTHGALLRKILFPAEVLPLVAVLAQGIHFVLALPILLVGLVLGVYGLFGAKVAIGLPLIQLPFLIFLETVLILGAGLFLASLTVHFRDVKDILATFLSLWFFATPILYVLPELKSGPLVTLLKLNPAAILFAAFRDALFFSRWVPLSSWLVLTGLAVVVFSTGYAFFDRLRDSLAEAV